MFHKEFFYSESVLLLTSSHLRPGLVLLGLFPWVVVTGIVEFTVVILGVHVVSDRFSDSHEVLHVSLVGDVGVSVVLEVFEHVHVLIHESVSSNSWEGEGVVIKFPGVDGKLW